MPPRRTLGARRFAPRRFTPSPEKSVLSRGTRCAFRASRLPAAWRYALLTATENGSIPRVVYGTPDRPLRVGDLELPCFVLEDGRRVVLQLSLLAAMGMECSVDEVGTFRLRRLLAFLLSKGLDVKELAKSIHDPIEFRLPDSNRIAYGYEAMLLPRLCDAVIDARTRGFLAESRMLAQAAQCQSFMRQLARQGFMLMLEEVTGYRRAETRLLEAGPAAAAE
jgi:hypothetical protein